VSAYLLKHSKPGKEMFSLRDGKKVGTATFELALQFAGSDGHMLGVWQGRYTYHWRKVVAM
jgi:hypothetical protein